MRVDTGRGVSGRAAGRHGPFEFLCHCRMNRWIARCRTSPGGRSARRSGASLCPAAVFSLPTACRARWLLALARLAHRAVQGWQRKRQLSLGVREEGEGKRRGQRLPGGGRVGPSVGLATTARVFPPGCPVLKSVCRAQGGRRACAFQPSSMQCGTNQAAVSHKRSKCKKI